MVLGRILRLLVAGSTPFGARLQRIRARLVAGFCWPWSNPDSSGQLVDDVKLDGFSMPWNTMPDAGRLAAGIPKSNFWASDPNGIDQVGACIRRRDLSLTT